MDELIQWIKDNFNDAAVVFVVAFGLGWIVERELMAEEVSQVMEKYENKLICAPFDPVIPTGDRECWVVRKFVHPK